MMDNTVNGRVPEFLSSHFLQHSDTLIYELRDRKCRLAIPQPHANFCKRNLSYCEAVEEFTIGYYAVALL